MNQRDWTRRQFSSRALVATAGALLLPTALVAAVHTVQRGDTLSGLALRYGVSVGGIKKANGLSSDLIKIGQKLNIPEAVPKTDLLKGVQRATASVSVKQGRWNTIVVHHSGIKYGNAASYGRYHKENRGMQNGLAYHFVIGNGIDSGDGEIEVGPRWMKQLQGGHVRKYSVNQTGIGICLVGNFMETRPSTRQPSAFTQLMDWLRGDILKSRPKFAGHKEIDGPHHTVCPGKYFPLADMHRRFD